MTREAKLEAALREAKNKYDNWLLDDDYDAHGLLHEMADIIKLALSTPADDSEPVAWVPEDELPESLPTWAYNALYPYSRVDGIRLFPIFTRPSPSISDEVVDRLRRQVKAAHPNHKTMYVYVDDLRAALQAASLPAVERAPVVTDEPDWAPIQDAIDAWAKRQFADCPESLGCIMSWSDIISQVAAAALSQREKEGEG